ncbi:MAG: adenine phosphoribosyltransferase [Tessaracoccus sp.]
MGVDIAALVRDFPDYPKPGVLFKDITPLLASGDGFRAAIDRLVALAPDDVDHVVGIEARGFIFAAPVALALGAGFVPVRKPGKLPGELFEESYDLEYGQETLTMRTDAIRPGSRVLIVDDVLATGGTVAATSALLGQAGASLAQVAVVVELTALPGRERLAASGIDQLSSLLQV